MLLPADIKDLNEGIARVKEFPLVRVFLTLDRVPHRFREEYIKQLVAYAAQAVEVHWWFDKMYKSYAFDLSYKPVSDWVKPGPTCAGCGAPRKDYVSACDYCKRLPNV